MYPDDVSLERWAAQVHALYVGAVTIARRDLTTAQRQQARAEAEAWLQQLCAPYATDYSAAQRQLCQRALKHLQELFVFVREPDVPPDNNAAERSLRHLVTSRKISGGTGPRPAPRQR
jgi:Transposase IS66 family